MSPASLSPHAFVDRWRAASGNERQLYQQHFLDLCSLVGHPTPAEDDPAGERFGFEPGVKKLGGGSGFADAWKRGFFAMEYKKPHADLDRAYTQLQQYREALQNPPLLVVSDMRTIQIHTNFTNTVKRVVTLTLDDLLTVAGQTALRDLFYNPDAFRDAQTTEQVTKVAAAQFAALAQYLHDQGAAPDAVAHFLIRLLFCLFAEDINLLPNRLFTDLTEQGRSDPARFNRQLRQLFEAMAHGDSFGRDVIPHFNGGLFDDDATLALDGEAIRMLHAVAGLDWSAIEPSIFGTLFERSLDPAKRAQLGAHYTSRDDILLIVEPVLMEPLRREWAALQAEAREKAQQRDAATGGTRTQRANELRRLLDGFSDRLARQRVLDPACGSGNFLYVALQQLLDLGKEVSAFGTELGLPFAFPQVSPLQLYGIEINETAHELAQATVWIGYIQWLHENGFGVPPEPILKRMDNIRRMDAILAFDADGNPVEPAWPVADVIIGNPPFLGDKKMRGELGAETVENIRSLYGDRIPGQSDLVCYWFERARAMIERGELQRAGLLATQGIRGGANRRVLERIKQTGDIFWAESDRNWVLDGATVHVSMVGFDDGTETVRMLDGRPVETINSDLSTAVDLTSASQLTENAGVSFIGTQKSGPFDLTPDQAKDMIAQLGNPNGRPNSDVVKPWINAKDVTQVNRGMWVIDFGVDMSEADAAMYEAPFEYIRTYVKPMRDGVNRRNHREKWWLFGESRPGMRQAIGQLERFIATPMVSKHRLFVWVQRGTIPENLLVVVARNDDYFFGVLHSRFHELWSRRQGTQLREAESGQRYTPSTTFETFPFPWTPGHEPADDPRVQAIAAAAGDLDAKRAAWLNPPGLAEAELKKRTLTNLYNAKPTWLQMAHARLDDAVAAAYGWPADLDDEELLARLLALNLERAGA